MEFNLSKVEFSNADIKRDLVLPKRLTKELAEDIGIMVGDGHIGKYTYNNKNSHQIRCDGSYSSDLLYYKNFVIPLKYFVIPLKFKLYNIKFKINLWRKDELFIRAYSQGLYNFYTKILGLNSERKNNIGVPKMIIYSSKQIKKAFLRGLFSTDFTLAFKKKHKDRLYYPTCRLEVSSENLILDLEKLFLDFGFRKSVCYDIHKIHPKSKNLSINHSICLNGKKELEKWVKKIGFNNPKNILKYNYWKRFGYCPRHNEVVDLLKNEPEGIRTPDLLT